jgi:hypothetical protein
MSQFIRVMGSSEAIIIKIPRMKLSHENIKPMIAVADRYTDLIHIWGFWRSGSPIQMTSRMPGQNSQTATVRQSEAR